MDKTNQLIKNFSYRAEIDGLRAIAVLAVLFFHTDFLGCSGGFVGVDIFFVISGFLITSLIWRDLEQEKFSFAHFWERRARRIVPALFAVTVATLVGGWFVLLPSDFESLGKAGASQSFFAANIHYWRESGYFTTAADVKPLLHTWSLAVEEQFYLFAPFCLFAIFQLHRFKTRRAVICLLAIAFLASFGLSVFGVTRYRTASFFLLPTRAWELLFGSLVVFLPRPQFLKSKSMLNEAMSVVGIVLMLAPIFIYTRETAFPGLAALPPCLGAAIFIFSNGIKLTSLGSALSTKPVVFVGLISYSLYLWHWPFLAFARYLSPEPISIVLKLALILLGVLAAVLSWRFVETPFRKRTLGKTRKSMFSYAGSMIVVVLALGLTITQTSGFPERYSPETLLLAEGKNDRVVYRNLEWSDVQQANFEHIGDPNSDQPLVLFVWGDSFAMAALPAADTFLENHQLRGFAALHTSTPPTVGFSHVEGKGIQDDKDLYDEGILKFISQQKIPHVMLIACWRAYAGSSSRFENALTETVNRITKTGAQPWIILEPPKNSFNVPRILGQPLLSDKYVSELIRSNQEASGISGVNPQLAKRIEELGGIVVNPLGAFRDKTTGIYNVKLDNKSLYYDKGHLSTAGANLVILPLLEQACKEIVQQTETAFSTQTNQIEITTGEQ
ncbi:acyltransferase [Mariniblastus sp.]|nr:acyltransferase [Mariniblastus sp.]